MRWPVVVGSIILLLVVGVGAHGQESDPVEGVTDQDQIQIGRGNDGSETEAEDGADALDDKTVEAVNQLLLGSRFTTAPPQGRKGQLNRFRFENEQTTFSFGGAIWANYSFQSWKSSDEGKKRGLNFDNLRLAFDGSYGEHLLFSAQYRVYSYTRALHHAWFGFRWRDSNQIELGISQVPFGLLPFATNSFWFGLGYYVGMEDDYDAGVKWFHNRGPWDLHLAYYINEEYNDATNLNRYSVDIVRDGDQQNEEINQFNARLAYTFGEGTESSSEFGISGEIGQLDNLTTDRMGEHWQAAVHYSGRYGGWNPEVQIARYEYSPENPPGIDDRLVLMGNLTSTRLVAAKGTVVNLNIRRFWDVSWGPFKKFNAYINYSHQF
ncbi:MAG: hypothetical protein V2I67_07495, partial [Thermoanaerobaculales bacterium]|nr:hypothetical protein [Thermoanaerobaculales bacterium]